MNNKIPKELTDRQELQRQKTINDVLRAIATMKAEGYCLKIKNLIEFTGLSRSVFGKSHIRKVLIDNGIVDAKPDVAWAFQSSAKLSKEQKLRLKLKEKDEHIKRITDENICLKSECELLRGKLFLLMQKQSFE